MKKQLLLAIAGIAMLVAVRKPATAAELRLTNEEIFGKALTIYDDVLTTYNKYKGENDKADEGGKKISKEQYDELKKKIDDANNLFDQYTRIGSIEDHKKASRYFITVLTGYDLTFLNDLKRYRDAYALIADLEKDLSTVKYYSYPLYYSANGKRYYIDKDKPSNVAKSFYVEMTETCTNLSKSDETIKYAGMAYGYYNYGDYNLWWCAHLRYYHSNKLYKRDADMVDAAEKVIYSMSGLSKKDIRKILDSNWVNYKHAHDLLNTMLTDKPNLSRGGEVWAKAAENFEKLDEDSWALEYYKKAVKDGYGDRYYLLKIMDFGKSKKETGLVGDAASVFDNRKLYGYGCEDLKTVAGYFDYAGNNLKATELNGKYSECLKKQTQEERRAARRTKMLLSISPGAFLSGNVQGSLQLGGRKLMHEFGVKKTGDQRDYAWDMLGKDIKTSERLRWSGYGYYYTMKIFSKSARKGSLPYFGFQARYTEKKFNQVNTTVTEESTNTYKGYQTFNPTEKRIEFLFQTGALYMGKYFHADMSFGWGLAHSTFNVGNADYPSSSYNYGNVMLNDRKTTRIGLALRMGFMVGINIINKNYSRF